jgi:hypothetical protein
MHGMEQGEARRRARELGGIAVEARPGKVPGDWLIGGWASQKDSVWIVISLDRKTVLADKSQEEPQG